MPHIKIDNFKKIMITDDPNEESKMKIYNIVMKQWERIKRNIPSIRAAY